LIGLEPVGNYGPKTEEAVKAFQSKNGLTADGIVGPTTWAKIMGEAPQAAPVVSQPSAPIAPVGPLKLDKLKGHIPDAVIAMIPDTAAKFQINTPLRLAHFLAQCGHESGGFKATSENLNYSAKGLMGIFKKYFPTEFKFRGRGYIQLTGKANYTAFGKAIGEDITANPDVVSGKYALLSAAWFWSNNGLNKLADGGSTDAVVTTITKRVNGGTIGLADRIKHFKEYYHLLA